MTTPAQREALASISALLAVLYAWRRFKRSHNLHNAELTCCAKTLKLWNTLDELEKEILDERAETRHPPREGA